ncbi:MAG: alkaline phosphatase family protein [Proteobacteria bacterium]|nr:alkaline phosphatase family protein [Pseudomonadota bacterium]
MMYSFDDRADLPWPNSILDRGVIIGHTTTNSSRIWVRTGKKGDFTLLVFDRKKNQLADKFTALRQASKFLTEEDIVPFENFIHSFSTSDKTDYTTVIEVNELKPGTQYTYAVLEKIEANQFKFILGHDKRRRFSTPFGAEQYAFGLFSCHQPYTDPKFYANFFNVMGGRDQPEIKNMDVWKTAQSAFAKKRENAALEFLIAGGDQAYCDGCNSLNIWKYLEKTIKNHKKNGTRLPNREEMISWYRNMYKGYWGFPTLKSIYGQYPTYMIWDDHEIRDGWGSHKLEGADKEINEVLFEKWDEYIDEKTALILINDMCEAAKQVYKEYQHSHNPLSDDDNIYDYTFTANASLFYVLDGRGQRNFDREKYKILGEAQMKRFHKKVNDLDPQKTKFLFVVSAVPVIHAKQMLANNAEGWLADKANITDDLRDSWEHPIHNDERRELLDILFAAANKGIMVCILSGDVHTTAMFKMERAGKKIHQLTSSAITYNTPRMLSWALGKTIADDGESQEDNYKYERLKMLLDPSFAIIKVDTRTGQEKITFQVYKAQTIKGNDEENRELSKLERNRGDILEKEFLISSSIDKSILYKDQ